MEQTEEVIEKIDTFFEKKKLSIEEKYFVTKKMNENYWMDMQEELEDSIEQELDIVGQEDEEEQEDEKEEGEEDSEEEGEVKPVKPERTIRGRPIIKRPRVKVS